MLVVARRRPDAFGEGEPQWELVKPWSQWTGLDWDDPRVLDADADLDAIAVKASQLYEAPVRLSPGT